MAAPTSEGHGSVSDPQRVAPAPLEGKPHGGRPAPDRLLYCVPGAWTDEWYDEPGAWWQWVCAFWGWSHDEWHAFLARWRHTPDGERRELMARTGVWFFDWRRMAGGSLRGSSRAAAEEIAADLASLPSEVEVTLLGHSKGGNALKHLLAVRRAWPGAAPSRAIFVDAPVDWVREVASGLMGLGIERCRLDPRSCAIPLATVNNWLDPSGGRIKGVRNYQTMVWQDYLVPWPPHGMKGFLAAKVLRDLGGLPVYTDRPGQGEVNR